LPPRGSQSSGDVGFSSSSFVSFCFLTKLIQYALSAYRAFSKKMAREG
jgi:hypothetical protein